MKLKIHRCQTKEIVFLFCFYILVFQNPLTEYVSGIFNYVDEVFALLSVVFMLYLGTKSVQKLVVTKNTLSMVAFLSIFIICGLTANVIYQYQPANLVLKDMYVNIKFFLSVATGFYLFRYVYPPKGMMLRHTKCCTVILFLLLLIDVVFDIFPDHGYRYGIKARSLIFGHVTYLAAACVFLLSVLMFYHEKWNWTYIAMNLMLLLSTTRGKALAGGVAYLFVMYFVVFNRKKIKLWHIILIGIMGLYIAWDQISFYYLELSGQSARSILTQTSFEILNDYFPIGTGFGTYASDVAGEYYSPVYIKYGFALMYDLREEYGYFSDTFWPIIIGQTGFIGTICYLVALLKLFLKTIRVRLVDRKAYAAVLFIFIYLLISSTSEPTFCNSVSIPLAMLLGCALHLEGGIDGTHQKILDVRKE